MVASLPTNPSRDVKLKIPFVVHFSPTSITSDSLNIYFADWSLSIFYNCFEQHRYVITEMHDNIHPVDPIHVQVIYIYYRSLNTSFTWVDIHVPNSSTYRIHMKTSTCFIRDRLRPGSCLAPIVKAGVIKTHSSVFLSVRLSVKKTLTWLIISAVLMIDHWYLAHIFFMTSPF